MAMIDRTLLESREITPASTKTSFGELLAHRVEIGGVLLLDGVLARPGEVVGEALVLVAELRILAGESAGVGDGVHPVGDRRGDRPHG